LISSSCQKERDREARPVAEGSGEDWWSAAQIRGRGLSAAAAVTLKKEVLCARASLDMGPGRGHGSAELGEDDAFVAHLGARQMLVLLGLCPGFVGKRVQYRRLLRKDEQHGEQKRKRPEATHAESIR
jgi:hypothetical protein